MRAIALMFEQEKALKSILPIFPPQDIENRIGTPIPSVTVAAMYPFVFDSIKDPGLSTLLGVDFSYAGSKDAKYEHFFKEEKLVATGFTAQVSLAYKAARKYADAHGIKIYNATRGGKLEVFERVDFDSLF